MVPARPRDGTAVDRWRHETRTITRRFGLCVVPRRLGVGEKDQACIGGVVSTGKMTLIRRSHMEFSHAHSISSGGIYNKSTKNGQLVH